MVQVGTPGAKKGLFSVRKLQASGLGGSLAHEFRVHLNLCSLHTPPLLGLTAFIAYKTLASTLFNTFENV